MRTFGTDGFEERTVQSGNVRLRCVTAGPADGPLALFLHGFPARWSTWRGILPAFARAGYLAVAPDLRGYGASDRPSGVESYSILRIVEDVVAILDAFGRQRSLVVGHDVGGGVAWAMAMAHPERVERLAILNSVHPVGFERQIRKWSQIKKSWYVFLFLLPWVPEWWLSRRDFRFVHRSLDVPTTIVWGDREKHLDPELAAPPADWVSDVRVEHVPEAGHWIHHDAPEKVSALLLSNAGSPPNGEPG